MDVVQDAKAISDTRLQVTLSKPSNDWLYRMSTRVGAMMTEKETAALATKPVGTGPYVFDQWRRGDSISLKANPSYWGKKPYFQQVTLKYFKDPTALNNALLTKTINVIGTVQAPESLAQFQGNDAYEIVEGSTNGEVLLSMNNGKAPFDNVKVRQAARYAIDHKALLDTCWAGHGSLVGSMVPPTDRGTRTSPASTPTTSPRPRPSSPRRTPQPPPCACASRPCRMPSRAARWSRASSSRPVSR